jgi:hypothetical protein
MDTFRQIVQMLDGYKLRHIDVLGNDDSTSRFTEFYRLLKDGTIKTDEDAAKHFYGKDCSPSDNRYRTFKSEFKDRLLNTLFFIDTNNEAVSGHIATYYRVKKEWAAIENLFRQNMVKPTIEMAEGLLPICYKYEFTELLVSILERLKALYGTQIGDKKTYLEYKEKFWHYKAILDAEHIAKEVFEELRIEYVKSSQFRPEMSVNAQAGYDKIRPYLEQYDSVVLHMFGYHVKSAIYSLAYDFQGLLNVTEEAIEFLNTKPFDTKNIISIYKNQQFIALFMLRRYDMCFPLIEETLKMKQLGSINWFKTMEKKVLLNLRTGHYTVAFAAYVEARNTKGFKDLFGMSAEVWQLFKANFYFLASVGQLPNVDKHDKQYFDSFRLNKFLNETPVLGHDKKGMNIAVLIIQIALMITEKMYDALLDKIEAIGMYLQRHVNKSDAAQYRSNQYIKILMEIPKAGFHRVAIERQVKKFLADLSSVRENFIEAGYFLEIMPYEMLWGLLLPQFGLKHIDPTTLRKN